MNVKNKKLSPGLIEDAPIMKKQSGFTLIEVLVALAVFSVGILAVAAMQVMAIRGSSYSNHLTEAVNVAGDRMETLMNLQYTSTVTDPLLQELFVDGPAGLDSEGVAADQQLPPFVSESSNVTYNVSWNIAPNVPVAGSMTVRVIVTWTEGGAQKRMALDFIKAET